MFFKIKVIFVSLLSIFIKTNVSIQSYLKWFSKTVFIKSFFCSLFQLIKVHHLLVTNHMPRYKTKYTIFLLAHLGTKKYYFFSFLITNLFIFGVKRGSWWLLRITFLSIKLHYYFLLNRVLLNKFVYCLKVYTLKQIPLFSFLSRFLFCQCFIYKLHKMVYSLSFSSFSLLL